MHDAKCVGAKSQWRHAAQCERERRMLGVYEEVGMVGQQVI